VDSGGTLPAISYQSLSAAAMADLPGGLSHTGRRPVAGEIALPVDTRPARPIVLGKMHMHPPCRARQGG